MKKIILWVAAVSAATFMVSCGQEGHQITVTNDTDIDRS